MGKTLAGRFVSWLAVAVGCFFGFVGWAQLGLAYAPAFAERDTSWYLVWFGAAGQVLWGLGFVLGSLIALFRRRAAGIVFLSVMPAAAFCLAYPSAGYLVWRADGGWFETPVPVIAIGLAALFYAPFLAPLCLWRKKRRAALVFALAVFPAGFVFAGSRWSVALLPGLVGCSVPFLVFGQFWLRTAKLGWPSLVQPCSPRKRVLAVVATCVGILCLDVVFTLMLSGLGSSLFSGDCRGHAPYLHPDSPTHAVFTAKILFAGRSIRGIIRPQSILRGDPADSIRDHGAGDWAIGMVEETFWGTPHWARFVLLTNNLYWEGETYFIDGRRDQGLLTQYLPVVGGGVSCSRTRPAQTAVVDLRLLRRPPAGGTRIMGYVRGPGVFTSLRDRPAKAPFLAGIRIQVTGSAYTGTVVTDSTGVYELDDLAPGDYTLHLLTPDTQTVGFFEHEGSPAAIHLDPGGVVERNFDLFWDGRIEGLVKDTAGTPAHAWVELLSADGSSIPGYVRSTEITAADGSYKFHKIPPGRYLVLVNPHGPGSEAPHDRQYYPSGVRRDKARVFELAEGQRITGIDFTTPIPTRTAWQ